MEHTLEWLTEEEGCITFYENGTPFLEADFFVTGEEEAEFRIQDIVVAENSSEADKMCDKITQKMTECISESFRLLWEEGLEETVLVESEGTQFAKTLSSTTVVQKIYSEYMMKCYLKAQKSTGCGKDFLKLTKTEDGFCVENEAGTFFCRLLPYSSKQSGESCFYLYEVEVKQEERKKGVATACLMELFAMLSREEPVTIYLQVGSYNEPAVHLYKKLGFEISEELCYYAWEE